MAGCELCYGDYRGLSLILNYHKVLSLLTLLNAEICKYFMLGKFLENDSWDSHHNLICDKHVS